MELVNISVLEAADLAVGRLQPFDASWVPTYPVFKDPAQNLEPGTSLCRLGFPFHRIEPQFDTAKDSFLLPPGSVPPPFFPIEGILTRMIRAGTHPTAGYNIGFIETSSPGLMGQSGGPIFVTHGTVWGIQSQTRHLPLGFKPEVKDGSKVHVEHQFLNVGWGAHPETVIGFLKDLGVAYSLSGY